ncbi:MAG: PTS sugar transporter subunit IIA [Kiritimatiellae bacterium]|jgi:PTS system nitrogen regulatory IIA component|nr:PTS sugar transporter subunit IIA [Kiritimatiellia bacterium]
MQLTINDVARFLNISEKTLYRMIRHGEIPARKVHDQYRFNRTELLEWAIKHHKAISREFVKNDEKAASAARMPLLSEALKSGGVFYGLEGTDKKSALRSLVAALRLPHGADRELLLKMLLAREEMASTSIGEGIAVPHARNPLVLQVAEPQVTIGFLQTPVDFQALDGKPVFALFSIITPAVRMHLHFLSRLAFALQDNGFRELIMRQAESAQIICGLARVEASFAPATGKT